MDENLLHTPQCFTNHMGLWLCEAKFLADSMNAIKSGLWRGTLPNAMRAGALSPNELRYLQSQDGSVLGLNALKSTTEPAGASNQGRPYMMTGDGIAIIEVSGPMMKGYSKFGGCSTIETRRMLRLAVKDEAVTSIVLLIDSPGGTASGTSELASDVAQANEAKPVYAHVEDCCASAAYWVAAQSRRITANSTAQVGSIGTMGIVHDTSKAAELAGVAVHIITTAEYKAVGAPGVPVLPEHLNYLQGLANSINDFFLKAVKDGRQLDAKSMKEVTNGKVWVSSDAKSLGLIDAVSTLDAAVAFISAKVQAKKNTSKMNAMLHGKE